MAPQRARKVNTNSSATMTKLANLAKQAGTAFSNNDVAAHSREILNGGFDMKEFYNASLALNACDLGVLVYMRDKGLRYDDIKLEQRAIHATALHIRIPQLFVSLNRLKSAGLI